MIFQQRYIQFIDELEDISRKHDGVTDTDVRERLREIINYCFVWGNYDELEFPRRFGMPTVEGDFEIFKALNSFVSDTVDQATEVGQERHSLIEDENVISSEGNEYFYFLGFSELLSEAHKPAPDDFFEYFDYNADE